MTTAQKIVAILIPVHDGWDYTQKCLYDLGALLHNDAGDSSVRFSVVLIDDGSTDGTAGFVAKDFPDVHVLQGDGSLWWSGGINLGAQYAMDKLQAHYLLLWNNDINAAPGYFEQVASVVANEKQITVWGSVVRDMDNPERIWSMGGKFNPRTGARYMLGLDKPVVHIPQKPWEADWLTGMGTLVPVNVVKSIGLWNAKDFPQYHGDSDFTCRAREAGFSLRVHPKMVIFNATENSAPLHQGQFRKLLRSLVHIKSKYNFRKDLKFYRRHKAAPQAYLTLLWRYFRYVGGFFKWKMIQTLGVNKQPR